MSTTVLIFFVALTLSIAVAQLNSVDDKDCLVYYDFTRANPLASLGTISLSTSVVGTVSFNSSEGLILTGNGRLYGAYTPLLNALEANSMSVEVLAKWSSAGFGFEEYVVEKGPWSGSYLAGITASGGSTWVGQFCGSAMSSCISSTSNSLYPGQWYHMVYVWDKVQRKRFIYVNGTLFQRDSNTINGAFNPNTYGLSIGGRETNTYMVYGSVKYLKLHQRALNQTEANNRYLLTSNPVFPDATSSWWCPSLILVGTPAQCIFTARINGLPFTLYYAPTFNDSLGTGNFSSMPSNGHAFGQATDAANVYRVRYTPASYGSMVLTEMVSGATITVRVSVLPARYRVRTLAGQAAINSLTDGVGTNARFSNSYGTLPLSPAGDLLIADTFNCVIRKYNASTGVVSSVTTAGCGSSVDGAIATTVRTNLPTGFWADPVQTDTLYWFENSCVRKHNLTTNTLTTFAGTMTYDTVDGVGTNALFRNPRSMVRLRTNVFWVASENDQCMRQVDMSGTVSSVLGQCGVAGATNGVGTSAQLNFARSIGLLSSGLVVFAEYNNHCLRLADPVTVTVSSFVGLCNTAAYADGVGTSARFTSPWNLVVDSYDIIYVADQGNRLIRRVDPRTSQVTTLMGISGTQGTSDGYLGTASFRTLRDMSIYPADLSVYLTDDGAIRVLEPDYVMPDSSSVLKCATTVSYNLTYPTLSCVFTAQQANQTILTTSTYVLSALPLNITVFNSSTSIGQPSLQITERVSSVFGLIVTIPNALPSSSFQISFNSTYFFTQGAPVVNSPIMNCTSSIAFVSTPLACSIYLSVSNQSAAVTASLISVYVADLPTSWSSAAVGQLSTIQPSSGFSFAFQYTTPAVSGVYQLMVAYTNVTLAAFPISVIDTPDATTDFGCVMF